MRRLASITILLSCLGLLAAQKGPAEAATTTLGNGTNPGNATRAPGGAATNVDTFTLVTSSGTDTATAVTVTLAAGTSEALSLVEITNSGGGTVYGSQANPASNTVSITGMSIPVSTSSTSFRVRITPKSHADMPAPPGTSYAVTATITAFTSTNAQAGSDTASSTITIDNLSPANVTGATATPGDAQVALSWTNPGGDFSRVVVLRNTATITDVPVEGSSPLVGDTIGTSTVRSTTTGASFTDTALTNGTLYFYRIFAKDTNGNYAATGVEVSATPQPITTIGNGSNPGNVTRAPGAAATNVDTFTLVTSSGTDTVTAVTVTLAAGTSEALSLVEITNSGGGTVYGSQANPASDTVSIQGMSIPVSTSSTGFRVRITPKSHADMPAPPGASYAVTAPITAFTSTNAQAGSDTASSTVTIDNLSPANVTGATATPGESQVALSWTNPGGDFSRVVVLRNTATITDVPTEGSSPSVGDTIGTSTVRSTTTGASFTDTALTNGTLYFYRIFAKDTNGNYAATGIEVSTTPCSSVPDSTYVAVSARSGQATVYWSSSDPVVILRKLSGPITDVPNNGITYEVSSVIGASTVVYADSVPGASLTQPGLASDGTTYYYKVFAKAAGACYSAGTEVNATPVASGPVWSYMMAGGSALKAPTTDESGNLYVATNANRMISLAPSTGFHNWAPKATSQPIQSYLVWTPQSSGATSLVYGGDQGGTVYAVETAGGTTTSPGWQTVLSGADAIQAGISVQIRSYSDSAFATAYPGTYDVVFSATSNTTGSFTTNNKVFALRSDTGVVLWTFNPCSPTCGNNVDQVVGQPWVDYSRNYLYVTSRAGTGGTQSSLWVLDSRTGAVVTSFALGHLSTAPAQSFDGATLWIGNENGDLYAVDLLPGTPALKWTGPLALGGGAQLKGFVWEDWYTAGRLYFSTSNGAVRCFQDPGIGGTPSPSTVCSGWSAISTAVAGATTGVLLDNLYVGSWTGTTGTIVPIDPATGTAGTAYMVGDGTKQVGDVSTSDGTQVFVGTTEGKVFKISLPLP